MALEPRRHGLTILRRKSNSAAVGVTSNTIWGVVVTGPGADADLFPLNTPVLVPNVDAVLADPTATGATGTLPTVLKALSQHGRAAGVIVRVEIGAGEDADDIADATDVNVIAGLEALRLARQTLGVRPTILATPGLDTIPVRAALAVTLQKVKG
ncbi:MAG: phage tail protein, partial [Caulobacteraceae bacterium]